MLQLANLQHKHAASSNQAMGCHMCCIEVRHRQAQARSAARVTNQAYDPAYPREYLIQDI